MLAFKELVVLIIGVLINMSLFEATEISNPTTEISNTILLMATVKSTRAERTRVNKKKESAKKSIEESIESMQEVTPFDPNLREAQFTNLMISLLAERDQRYILFQAIYVILHSILNLAENAQTDTNLQEFKRRIESDELHDDSGSASILEILDQLLLMTYQDKHKKMNTNRSLKTIRVLQSFDINFSEEFQTNLKIFNLKLEMTSSEGFNSEGLEGLLELESSTVGKLNQIVSDSFERYMKKEIPQMEKKKQKLINQIEEENSSILQAIDDKTISAVKGVSRDVINTAIQGSFGGYVTAAVSLGVWGTGIATGGFIAGLAATSGLAAAPIIAAGTLVSVSRRQKRAKEISHMKSIIMQMAIQDLFSDSNGDLSSEHFVDALLTLPATMAATITYWGDINDFSTNATNAVTGRENGELKEELKRLLSQYYMINFEEELEEEPIIELQCASNYKPWTLKIDESVLHFYGTTREFVLPLKYIAGVNFKMKDNSSIARDISMCTKQSSCRSNVIPTLVYAQIILVPSSMSDHYRSKIKILDNLKFTINAAKLNTNSDAKLHWNQLRVFFTTLRDKARNTPR